MKQTSPTDQQMETCTKSLEWGPGAPGFSEEHQHMFTYFSPVPQIAFGAPEGTVVIWEGARAPGPLVVTPVL